MTPTLDEFLSGGGQWMRTHRGIRIKISWHEKTDYLPQGIWCWYLILPEEQFPAPVDWDKIRLRPHEHAIGDSAKRSWDYSCFPDVGAHCGWTFGEMTKYLARDGSLRELVKVGCDYAHLWDRENGFPDGLSTVEMDARKAADNLIEMFPGRRELCAYSGEWTDQDQLYTAKHGARVSRASIPKITAEPLMHLWLPQEESAS